MSILSVKERLLQSPSEWSETSECDRKCHVCSAPSNGYHFNAPSCSACAAFFRRTVTLNKHFECSHSNECRINFAMRVICRACRYKRCIEAGMERRAVQPRRDSIMGRRKIKYNVISSTRQTHQRTHLKQQWTPCGSHSLQPFTQSLQPVDDKNPYIFIDSTNFEPFPAARSESLSSASSTTSSMAFDTPTMFLVLDQKVRPTTSTDNNGGHMDNNETTTSVTDTPTNNFESNYLMTPTNSESTFHSIASHTEDVLQNLLIEEARTNERRRILYCDRYLSDLLAEDSDIAFTVDDLRPLKYVNIRKEIRPMILVTFEWLRGWHAFPQLNLADKKFLLRKCVLYHTILEPAYLTRRLGYPGKFVMSNGMYVSMTDDSNLGWEDEDEIKSSTKTMIYRPLMNRVVAEIIEPMIKNELTHEEYCALKALVSWKSCLPSVSKPTKELLGKEINCLFASLNCHYLNLNYDDDTIAQRIGNLVLLVSNVFDVGMECLENHHKIEFFDLWQLDSLVIKLLKTHK